jgi:hypothetical protein
VATVATRREKKPCPTKKQKNPLDLDRPSHGRITLIDPASLRRHLPWSTEEQDIAVGIANLEPAKTIVGILKRYVE